MCGFAVGVIVVCVCGTCESGCRPVLRRERHGRGGDALLRELRLVYPRGEAGGGLSSSVVCAFLYTCVDCSSLSLLCVFRNSLNN
jgi:hypothetical protein